MLSTIVIGHLLNCFCKTCTVSLKLCYNVNVILVLSPFLYPSNSFYIHHFPGDDCFAELYLSLIQPNQFCKIIVFMVILYYRFTLKCFMPVLLHSIIW